MDKSNADTRLILQRRAIKQNYPDAVLLCRVGESYETFDDDAIITSQVLGIALTVKNNGEVSAAFSCRTLDAYLHKLVKAGYKVAISDLLEDPNASKEGV
ncbi:hypothetical protein Q4E93_22090 [Flavitalea sp. BT771]|uniref:hypothetical protein n=1 Tax=Flavitalea sp. BT771 TaxID=3063329 RepID=UPI0026E16089|nr:hypothetical protein [Flavitalea sp. BT771]MDO6433318.1 hypothetical protein [Flavitalea sp. BT771]MDV6222777.1 hypothetical protein [Flavitalea sp. BT771]